MLLMCKQRFGECPRAFQAEYVGSIPITRSTRPGAHPVLPSAVVAWRGAASLVPSAGAC